ncbi:MAG TPA: HAD-IC family P-type ATPase [Solirubrobacteraceae bacterium]|nr:HAD-IC family P-type ATPase [Solirubrobacteraceae bacterium]
MPAAVAGAAGAPPSSSADQAGRWHAQPAQAVLALLGSSPEGLTAAEAAVRLERTGPNVTGGRTAEPAGRLLLRQLTSPLIAVLLVAGITAMALGDPVDGAVVLGVVVANTVIGFIQEWRAGRAIQALDAMLPEQATVLRDGRRSAVTAAGIVPGDVLVLAPGDRIAADARVIGSHLLEVDESPLTGESLAVPKSSAPGAADAPVAERTGLLHGGTLVTSGVGTAVVVATGAATELGRIAGLLRRTEGVETPLTRKLAGFARWLSVVICAIAVVLLAVALLRGFSPLEATLAAIALAVAAIPEGMPAIVTIALAVGVQRMARRQAIVRHLPAVETLGSTTVICTDKTGTLTANRMRVSAAWTAGAAEWAPLQQAHRGLLEVAALCSDAEIGTAADPTEAALLDAALALGVDVEGLRAAHPRRDVLPFDGGRKLMVTVHDGFAMMKGAPEAVLARCPDAGDAAAAVERKAAEGMRVLAFARIEAPRDVPVERLLEGRWDLRGLTAMIDPPRERAIAAVAACHEAGIAVKMITGDHVATARSIGARFGLTGQGVSGAELDALDDDRLAAVAHEGAVFARVAPEHKLRLVRSLQEQGHVVAMTGDGVNDAPALKQADVGVAMGAGGTATAREAADLVLTDDDFASIEAAVEEGRRVYDNIQKAIAFVLPTNLGEALIVLIAVLFFPFSGGEPLLPVEPTQILWVNLIATVTLALPLAVERHEPGLMRRRPRPPATPLLEAWLVRRTIVAALVMTAVALLVYGLVRHESEAAGQTAAVTTIILFQVFYLLECRSLHASLFRMSLRGNPWVWAGIAAVLVLQAAFVYAPPLQSVFGSAALDAGSWGIALAAGMAIVPIIELEKRWRGAPRPRPAR